ncbi:MAG: hypothetical protein ACI84C_002091 [Flavobacteriales bacterium]|jgi:hypothetical protein
MVLSEGSREIFLSRLQHTAVRSGTYLVMPNAVKPAFLIPTEKRKIFKQAIDLIKPISRKGELKKRLIKALPLWVLKMVFPTLKIENPNAGSRHAVILPWNQNVTSKITIIVFDQELSNVEVEKYAFSEDTRHMVNNERSYLTRLKSDPESKIVVPEVKNFVEHQDYVCLIQDFYFGNYVENLTSNLYTFFDKLNSTDIHCLSEHPYILNKMPIIQDKLADFECDTLLTEMTKLFDQYKRTRFQVATMHSDFSTTNTVHTEDDKFVIIDWEDAEDDGINIDIPFFKFRRQLYDKGWWEINNAEGFLVVFHYIWFMVNKGNSEMLQKFRIDKGVFSS